MQMLTLGNRTLAYRSYGRDVSAGRPPLVLVHGAGGNHLVWPAKVRHLPHTAVFALDLPGHGASPGPGFVTISAYSEFIRDFVDALDLPLFVLAGHSMGGAITLDFALMYSHRLAGIGVIGAGARLRVAQSILEGILHDFNGTTELIVNQSYHPATSAEDKELYLRHLRENDPAVMHGDFLACHAFDISDRVEMLTIPTLILCGQEDQMAPPKYSLFLRDKIAASELHIIDRAGHNVMVEQPETVAGHFARFLDSLI